jgi:thioesterase domain-containing protein
VTDLSERIQNLTPERRALLERRLKEMESKRKVLLMLQEGDPKARRPLFFAHSLIGVSGYFINVVRHLPADQPVYGLQSPAFYGLRDPIERVEEAAAYFIEAIRQVQPEGPYLLGGHSSGGYIAYDMALQLMQTGEEVPLLVMIDQEAPSQPDEAISFVTELFSRSDAHESPEAMYCTSWAVSIGYGASLPFTVEDLAAVSIAERYERVADYLKKAGFLPDNAENEAVITVMKMFAYHSRGYDAYKEQHAGSDEEKRIFNGRTVLFRCTEPTTYEGFNITQSADKSPCSSWGRFCEGPIDVVDVPDSNHLTIVGEPCVSFMAERLKSYLDAAGRLVTRIAP